MDFDGMKAIVTTPYRRPYNNPIAVRAGAAVVPDFEKFSELAGWVWCLAPDGRTGWAPRGWLERNGDEWRITRDYDAIELTVNAGDTLSIEFEESGFYWVEAQDGSKGWVPIANVTIVPEALGEA